MSCDHVDDRDYGSFLNYGSKEGCATLRRLAAIYAYHPDYDEMWRP